SERRERPESRREPGVEDVRILRQAAGEALPALRRLLARDGDVARLAIPGGDLVAPPELARDAPVMDVAHPAQQLGAPDRRNELHLVDVRDHLLRERLRIHEPLLGHQRLDDRAAALAAPERHRMRLAAAAEAQLLQLRLQWAACRDASLAVEG